MVTVRIIGPVGRRIIAWYYNGELETMYREGTLRIWDTMEQIRANHPGCVFSNYVDA